MRVNCAGRVALMALFIVAIAGMQAVSDGETLVMWDMPFAEAFPGGLSLGPDGTVYVAANGGTEVIRLDPANDVYRSWGVGDRPEDVTVVDGVPFCTVAGANLIVYFHSEGLGTNSSPVPFPDVGPGEIHRGQNSDTGNYVFWIAERNAPGVLRYEYNQVIDAPEVFYDPSDGSIGHRAVPVSARQVTSEYEEFSYNVAYIPDPVAISPSATAYPFSEWPLPLGDDYYVQDIAVANDGALWISFGAPFLFRLDPIAGTLQQMETIQNVAIFQGLLPAADGSIWFGNIVDGSIGHFDPILGVSEVWRIPGTGEIYDLAFARDGAIWYTDRIAEAIGRFDPWTGEATIYPLPVDSEPLYLAIDTEGAIWFSCGFGNSIGRLTIPEQVPPQIP